MSTMRSVCRKIRESVPIDLHGNGNGAVGGDLTAAPYSAVAEGGINTPQTVNCEAPSHWSYGRSRTPCTVPPWARRLAGEPRISVFRPLPNILPWHPLFSLKKGRKCNLCVRYDLLPMSRVAHIP